MWLGIIFDYLFLHCYNINNWFNLPNQMRSSGPISFPFVVPFSHTPAKESLPPGSSETWPTWSSLNRLRTGTGRCKSLMQKWGFNEDGQTTCECGNEQTIKHLLVCPILPQPCTHEDLEEFNPELDPAPSIGRESGLDSKRRRRHPSRPIPSLLCQMCPVSWP